MDDVMTRLREVDEELQFAGDWNDRYRLLVEWGEALETLPEGDCASEWEVPGCTSPLWLRPRWVDGTLEVQGATPGVLPKALVALVVRLYDGLGEPQPPPPPIVDSLGLRQHLSPTRTLVLERMLSRTAAVAAVRP